MIGKRLINTGVAAAGALVPSEHFETVTYTGNGGTQRIGGYINRGAVFASSGSYIVTGDGLYESARGTNGTSVSFWMRSTGNNYETPIYTRTASAAAGWHIRTSTGGNGINWSWQNSSGSVVFASGEETVTLTDGWHHVVATWDGTTSTDGAKLYIDGSLFDSLTANATLASQTFTLSPTLGNDRQSGGRGIGTLDQVRFFNKALSSSEVTTLYGETHASTTISTTDIFSDNSGVALYQLDGNANDTGGVSGKFGSGGIFNGLQTSSASYINISSSTTSTTTTISLWMNSTIKDANVGNIFDAGGGSSGNSGFVIRRSATNGYLQLNFTHGTAGQNQTFTGTTDICDGNWHHICLVMESDDTFVCYLDGASHLSGTRTYWTSGDTHNLSVNRFGTNASSIGASSYGGKIDDVRIYSDVLTSTEVGYLYNNTTASIPTDNLVAYYKLDGDARDEQQLYDGTATNVTYAYDGTATNVTYQEATNFQPDLVWFKNRSSTSNHGLIDSVRGSYVVFADSTDQQYALVASDDVVFDSNGFTINSYNGAWINSNGNDFVAWCFKGGGPDVLNENGSINSQVSANQDSGFSIVKYTTPTANNFSVGHGLSSVPELVFFKGLNQTDNWITYASTTGATKYLRLNGSDAATTSSLPFNDTSPTSTVINLGSATTFWGTSIDTIAYCFHSVDGYSKIGSYTGNGSTSGPMVETGFEPAFVMVKRAVGGTASWVIYDNKRETENPRNVSLSPDLSNAEITQGSTVEVDFLSNGFQLKGGGNLTNASSSTYIYLAIAADPDTTTPTVENSFDVVTYTGDGTTSQIVDVDFKPDLVWVKARGLAQAPNIFDSIRGGELLRTSSTSASGGDYIDYIDDGFQFKVTDAGWNQSSQNYVAWCWKAGDHDDNLPQINTEGSIDSVVSVNAESGFSIIKYTAPSGSTTKFTAGHGLSSTPELVITRRIGGSSQWYTYSSTTGAEKYLMLNSSNGQSSTITDFWGTDGMSATTIGLTNNQACYPNEEHIAYCFHSVSGYQKIGSYNGASTTNPISVGFQPRFVLIKKYTGVDDWIIYDSQRGEDLKLRANQSNAEDSTRDDLDFTSTGFTLKGSYGLTNASGQSYIYLAIK